MEIKKLSKKISSVLTLALIFTSFQTSPLFAEGMDFAGAEDSTMNQPVTDDFQGTDPVPLPPSQVGESLEAPGDINGFDDNPITSVSDDTTSTDSTENQEDNAAVPSPDVTDWEAERRRLAKEAEARRAQEAKEAAKAALDAKIAAGKIIYDNLINIFAQDKEDVPNPYDRIKISTLSVRISESDVDAPSGTVISLNLTANDMENVVFHLLSMYKPELDPIKAIKDETLRFALITGLTKKYPAFKEFVDLIGGVKNFIKYMQVVPPSTTPSQIIHIIKK